MDPFTTYLFARPGFCEGVSRLIDFGGTLNVYNISQTGEEADAVAFYTDWHAVGVGICKAATKLKRQQRRRHGEQGRQECAGVAPQESRAK